MNLRWLNALLWGNSVALAWMWGLGLFFSVQITFMFGLDGLLMFAIPNAIGLMLFGVLTGMVAKRHSGGDESLAIFFEKLAKPFRLIFYIYQIVALSLTVFALVKYFFVPLLGTLDGFNGNAVVALAVTMAVFVLLAVGCLFGEEFGIRKIKAGHALLGALLFICILVVLFAVGGTSIGEGSKGLGMENGYTYNRFWGLAVPLFVGLLVGPWLDLQHWQRAIQIHREKTSIRLSYIFGGLIFFCLLLFHGYLAMWVMGNARESFTLATSRLDDLVYGHNIVVQYFSSGFSGNSWIPAAYFGFLVISILTTLDSGYVSLKWFLEKNVEKSENMLLSIIPKQIVSSPIPTFLMVAAVTLIGYFAKFELEYFMVFFASFFVGYAALAIARCFVPNSQQPLPQIRMFSMACLCLVIFAFGYMVDQNALMYVGSLLPLAYVVWLVTTTDLLRLVTEKAGEVMDAAAEIPAIKAIAKTEQPAPHRSGGSRFRWQSRCGGALRGEMVRLFHDRHLSGHELRGKRLFRNVSAVCRENPRAFLQRRDAGLRSEDHEILHPHPLLRAQVRPRDTRVRYHHGEDQGEGDEPEILHPGAPDFRIRGSASRKRAAKPSLRFLQGLRPARYSFRSLHGVREIPLILESRAFGRLSYPMKKKPAKGAALH